MKENITQWNTTIAAWEVGLTAEQSIQLQHPVLCVPHNFSTQEQSMLLSHIQTKPNDFVLKKLINLIIQKD